MLLHDIINKKIVYIASNKNCILKKLLYAEPFKKKFLYTSLKK